MKEIEHHLSSLRFFGKKEYLRRMVKEIELWVLVLSMYVFEFTRLFMVKKKLKVLT